MRWIAGIAGSAALASVPALTVAPPPTAGAWHRVGAAMTSRPGKGLHFFRTVMSPQGLGIVVVSSSDRPIRGSWSSWCEVNDDDAAVEELQGTLAGVKTAIAYPHVLAGATRCYVWVNTSPPDSQTRTAAAEFSY